MHYTQEEYNNKNPKRNSVFLIAVLLVLSLLLGAVTSYFVFKAIEPERVPGKLIQKTAIDYKVTDDAEVVIAKNNLLSMVMIEVKKGGSQFSGTGFIVDYVENGDAKNPIIMTNYHVIAEAVNNSVFGYKIYIKLFDKADFFDTPAQVLGYDSEIDIAVLKLGIDLQDVEHRVVEFGNSRQLQYGQRVVAIGNALGGGLSVTAGEISIPEVVQELQLEGSKADGTTQHLIQTSAAINSGNSGGVLLNMSGNGQVIGVNTYKVMAQTITVGQKIDIPADNVGLAVPSNMAVAILDYIKSSSGNYDQSIGEVARKRDILKLNLKNVSVVMDGQFNNLLKVDNDYRLGDLSDKIIVKINDVDINDLHQGTYVPSASIFPEISYYYGATPKPQLREHPFYRLELTFDNGFYTINELYLQREIPWLKELVAA
ncbi:MAG TPA: trypsin-like serine protease [Clostridiales bacterium]|nr:trypsin-like serine protease [Clostridiales bacterium]